MNTVRAIKFKEHDLIDAAIVSAKTGMSTSDSRWFIAQLCDRGVVKPASVSSGEENDDGVELGNIRFKEGSYQVTYVGVVVAGELVVYCAPKYCQTSVDLCHLRPVFDALKRYLSEEKEEGLSIPDSNGKTNRIAVLLALLSSYDEHGLYTNQERVQKTNGRGQIHWPATISSHLPVLQEGSPVYINYETSETRESASDFIGRLHRAVIHACSSELESCGLLEVFSLAPIELSETPVEDFGDSDSVVRAIDQELSVQFITWKQEVLKLMKLYFQPDSSLECESGLNCYGTSHFHVIWEKACKVAFGDMLDYRLKDLPITLSEKWSNRREETLLSIIPSPKWRIRTTEGSLEECAPADTLIPDIITISPANGGSGIEFRIYDAKYYAPSFGYRLHGVPGVDSITKQLLYQSAYRDFIVDNRISFLGNTFLIPCEGDDFIEKGDVSFDVVPDEGDPFTRYITVLLVPANRVLDCYISDRQLERLA